MITISLCMIVKNEEKVLRRCLDSVCDLVDEVIIVDTGSTDKTKEIAYTYTDKVYDFAWVHDFSAARNFAFSKASQEYIYSCDADEVLDEANRERFRALKEGLLPEIEIVQMKYGNQLSQNTIYNFDEEYRPKLFKRVRDFVWEEAIHETVRVTPVIYDSEVVITHMPEELHTSRDLKAFERQISKGEVLSKRLHNIYAKELFISGEKDDFINAMDFFESSVAECNRSAEEITEASLVVARGARLKQDYIKFFKYITKVLVSAECSEGCYELGEFYLGQGDLDEAIIWFYNACYETKPVLNLRLGGVSALEKLVECYSILGNEEQAEFYTRELNNYVI